ncbi:MAG: MATE family efflux transporter [Sedimentisphaerales bacterium]|nr:MATE family efflux transporter [Sedimentisphaerales bacterium]
MSLRKRIIMNAGSNWAGMLVAAAVGLVLFRTIRYNLGASFGVWALLSTGLRYPMILERAFSLSTNRFVAFYREDTDQMNRFVSASFGILMGLAFLTVAAAVLLSFFVSDIFKAITPESAHEAQITCILVGVTLALRIVEATFGGALRGYQYHTRSNAVAITANLLRLALTLGILALWKSMIAVQLAFVTAAAVSVLLMFSVARKSIEGFKIVVSKIGKNTIREIFRHTGHATARSGSMVFMFSTLVLVVGKVGSAEDVEVYAIASLIPSFIRGLLAGTQNVFLPVITSLNAGGQIEKVKAVIKKGTHISSALAGALLILLFAFTQEVLSIWFKEAVPSETVLVMRVLLISVAGRGFFGIWLPSLAGIGHLRGLTIAAITTAGGAIILELILLQGFVSVPMAASIALVIALSAYMGLWLPIYGLRKLGIHPSEYLKDSLSQPLAASLVSIAALLILSSILPKENVHWVLMLTLSIVIVIVSFTAISLRKETGELIAAVRNKYRSKKELRI